MPTTTNTNTNTNSGSSQYLRFLPEILRGGGFLDGYLKVIEALLSGRGDVPAAHAVTSLEGAIAAVPVLLDPALTPVTSSGDGATAPLTSPLTSPFLDYLARWVALAFDQNWALDKRREWLRRVVPLYKRRGTLVGLQAYLAMFVGGQARVEELSGGFIVGSKANATVGSSTYIAGARAYFFRVRINYGFAPDPFDIAEWRNVRQGARAIVDLEKPAHTTYTLRASTPGIIVGGARFGGATAADPAARGRGRATVGRDTLVWQDSKKIGAAG
jgi:phage tail-like protein